MKLTSPHLWSTDDPYLYKVITTIGVDNKVVDEYTTTTGIREVVFDAKKGFILNGKQMKLKGVNNHQDHAGVGSAILPTSIARLSASLHSTAVLRSLYRPQRHKATSPSHVREIN